MKPETQAALDKYNATYHPGVKERPYIEHPSADPLLAASRADVRRQADELRELVREAADLFSGDRMGVVTPAEIDDWLRRAREAAK